jgi:dipeptidyl aminopeptidase/acylaminoacyl peptidase
MKLTKYIILLLVLLANIGFSKQLPLTDFTKPSEFTRVSISPDGSKLAGVMELDGMDKVAIIDLKKMKPLSAKTFGENRRVSNLTWSGDDMIIMSVEKRVGFLDRKGEWDGVFAMRFDGKKDETLFAPGGIAQKGNTFGVSVIDGLPNDPKHILIQERTAGAVHVYKYNLKSKRKQMMSDPADKDSGAPYLSKNHKPVVAAAYDRINRNQFIYYKQEDATSWNKLDLSGDREDVTIRFGGNSKDPNIVYILSNHDASTMGLFELNLKTGDLKKLYRNETVDIENSIENQKNETIGFTLTPGYPEVIWVASEDPIAQVYKGLKLSFPNQALRIFNYTRDNNTMIFMAYSDKNPGEFYMLDLKKSKVKPLLNTRGWVKASEMSEMRPISMTARDGVELHGYLTLPLGKDPKNLPLVVNPHGGPHGPRDTWGYNPEIQLMANRGYAVLQINFRGSGGYGKEFEQSGYMKWGREMQNDVTDATLWAVDQGYADKDRLCLYGGSYGGYATLQGLVREPDLYKCGIGYVGVYDLKKMRTCGDIVVYGNKDYLNRVIGKDDEELEANSPAYNTDKIKANVFLAHGEDDVRVPMCQLNSLVDSLEKSGVKHEVMVRDEGHGYQNPKNKEDFYTRLISFLDENIGH